MRISDMEQKQIVQAAMPAQTILDEAKSHYKPRVSLTQMVESKAEKMIKPEQSKPVTEPDMDQNTKKLVMLTISSPFITTSGYYDLLGFNYRDGNEAKTTAIKKNLLIQHDFHSGKRGGKIVLLEPAKTAYAMFKLPAEYENPGFLHRYMQYQVKKAMAAQGYKATIEKDINGKSIDVVLEKDDESIAVEIAVTDKHEVINVRKDIFKAGFSRVVIICKDKNVVLAVKKKLDVEFGTDILSKVICCLLSDFIDGDMS
jgi:hypothetical protein